MSTNREKYLNANPLVRFTVQRFLHDMTAVVAQLAPKSLLDAGCGEGFVTARIAVALPECRIEAVDINADSIAFAMRYNARVNITYRIADLLATDEPGARYDIVICSEVLEHIADCAMVLQRLAGQCVGHLVLSVPNEPWFSLANLARLRHVWRGGSDPEHVQWWTRAGFARAIEPVGSLVRMQRSTFWNIAVVAVR